MEKTMYAVQTETKSTGNKPELFRRQLRIILIGGHARNVRHLIDRGRTAGWNIESHSGEVRGRGTKELRAQIGWADIVVITTRVNSHGGIFLARGYASSALKRNPICRYANIHSGRGEYPLNSLLVGKLELTSQKDKVTYLCN
jgi:hypothetical protein